MRENLVERAERIQTLISEKVLQTSDLITEKRIYRVCFRSVESATALLLSELLQVTTEFSYSASAKIYTFE